MSMLEVAGLAKSFGILELFRNVSFRIERGERAGFVGANGAGKTTLLKCLLGEEPADAGEIRFGGGTVGYVEQQANLGEGSLYEAFLDAFSDIRALATKKAMLERAIAAAEGDAQAAETQMAEYGRIVERFEHLGGYDYESRIRRVAFGLGFTEDEFSHEVSHMSGGQKTRVCLAKALLREPDFLFLDEPTNHLDISMIEWLESFLKSYAGGVLIISHDRFFLDRVTTKTLELDHQTVTVYAGNYSYYTKVRAERRAALTAAYEKQQTHIRETEEYIRRYKAGIKAKQARGRQSQLQRLERIVLPPEKARFNYFAFHPPAECAERVADFEDVTAAYGAHTIFSHLSLSVRRGDGMAIVGPNGAGKTTLLRLLIGELEAAAGSIKLGSRVKVGYFSQQHEGLHPTWTVLQEIAYEFDLDDESARRYLGAFLFQGDDVYRMVGELSGGEQSRLAFLKLMMTGANFLVLDEPTNHLDIPAKEAVEEALMAFPGTFVVVSHDRYFLDNVSNVTYELKDGVLTGYLGNYSYYREKLAEKEEEAAEEAALAAEAEKSHPAQKASAAKAQVQKAAQTPTHSQAQKDAEKEAARIAALTEDKRAELLARAEAELAMAEAELKMLEYEMNDPAVQSDPAKSAAIAAAYAEKTAEVEHRYERWGVLADE